MSFCGEQGLKKESETASECLMDVLIVSIHVIFIVVAGSTALVKWLKTRSPCDITNAITKQPWVRYPLHDARWILTLIVLTLNTIEFFEGVLIEMSDTTTRLHLYLPNVIVIVAGIFSLAFYDFVETYNIPRLLLMSLLYWCGALVAKSLKISALYEDGLNIHQVRLLFSWLILAVYVSLVLIEVYLLYRLRYVCTSPNLPNPEDELADLQYVHPYTSFLSHATWHWLTPLLYRGFSKPLEMLDLGSIPKVDHSKENFEKFKRIFENEKVKAAEKGDKPSLWMCFGRAYWGLMLVGGVYKLLADFLIFVPPMCLDGIVSFLITKDELQREGNVTLPLEAEPLTLGEYFSNGYILALVAFFAGILQGVFLQNNFFLSTRQGIRCKGALQSLVYDKTLRLSTWSLTEGGMTPGQVMNHMAIDSMHIFMLFYLLHFTWSLPIQVLVTFLLLYLQLGYSALISSSLILALCPFQYFIGKRLANAQKEILEQSDERLKKSNEVFQSIKLLKLYAWEHIFRQSIEKTRRRELKLLLKAACYRVLSICIVDGAPIAATFVTFTLYPYIENKPLEAAKVFSSLALFNILGLPLYVVTMIINAVAHARVSVSRLLPFLLAPEVKSITEALQNGVECETKEEEPEDSSIEKIPEVEVIQPAVPAIQVDFAPDIDQNADVDDTTEPLLPQNGVEVTQPTPVSQPSVLTARDTAIEIESGDFSWDLKGKDIVLHDISLKVPKGKLSIVVGAVGSGKSSLLSAILGEMTTYNGHVRIKKNLSVAYGAQKAWLMNATLKENIVFGHDVDANRYEEIIQCCALEPDISILPGGDSTEIGEKGINLSGGQKQRLSIARTLYADTDIVILDDAFSALDVHVSYHIFHRAILGYLLKQNKTVVLVTHQLQYLPYAHKIILMKDGKVQHDATLLEIKQFDPDTYKSWNKAIEQSKKEVEKKAKKSPTKVKEIDDHNDLNDMSAKVERVSEFAGETPIRSAISLASLATLDDLMDEGTTKETFPNTEQIELKDTEKGQLIEAEERATGSVSLKVYLDYARSATWLLTSLTLIGYVARQFLRMGTDYWLAEWSEAAKDHSLQQQRHPADTTLVDVSSIVAVNPNNSIASSSANATYGEVDGYFDVQYYIKGYALLCVISIVLGFFIIMFLEGMCLMAARNLHDSMLKSVIQAPLRFFDTTPIGRIINRLAGDTNTIDEKLPVTIDALLYSALYVIGGIVVNAVSTPMFMIPAIPMLLIFFAIQRFYIASSRELQRLDNVTRSPILAHFSETLGGLSTIRAYGDQKRFEARNWEEIDQNNTSFLYLHTANVWMGIRLDFLGAMIVFFAALCSITSSLYGYATPSLAGLAIAYSIMICAFLNWTMRDISEAEMWFSCVQRVAHYCHLPSEPYTTANDTNPPLDWPHTGEIFFERVSLRYDASLDPVIKGLNLRIRGGEKIGICGRTGSGKSSLTLGLFRIIDIFEGRITIDNIDIKKVPLSRLRSELSIIPQDPVLFSGTVRFNLDPDDRYTEDDMWKALDIAQLKDTIVALPEKLDAPVSEGGENFSQGQRQLFCLARAFLRRANILVMDEATASIDMETDNLIQDVVKTAFKDRTVITIAHRVATIMSSDTVIVLQNGEIIEHDTPQSLLATDTIFASMVRENK